MYYVYLLKLNDGTVYTGRSDNLQRRIKDHENGTVKSTKGKRPHSFIYYEAYTIKKDAIYRELYPKTGNGRKEIRKQLQYTLPSAASSSNG